MSSRSSPVSARVLVAVLAGGLAAGAMAPLAAAQTAPAADAAAPPAPAKKKSKRLDKHASPLAVIMAYRLWTDVPPVQDFVKASRPDPKSLDYIPLVETDPNRPTTRDKKGLTSLQSELEQDAKRNEARGKEAALPEVAPVAAAALANPKVRRRAKKLAKAGLPMAKAALPAAVKAALPAALKKTLPAVD